MANNAKETKKRIEKIHQSGILPQAASTNAPMDTSSVPIKTETQHQSELQQFTNLGSSIANGSALNGSSNQTSSSESSVASQLMDMSINPSALPNGSASLNNSLVPISPSNELIPGKFGAFEALIAPTPIYFTGNPLNNTKSTWGNSKCAFSLMYKFLTNKETEPCGKAERPAEACDKCQKIIPFFISAKWCREIPPQDVPSLGTLINQTFLLPNGSRLLVFASDAEAKASAWTSQPYEQGSLYIYKNQQKQKAVCFHVCRTCKRCEIKPLAGNDPSLFCKKGNPNSSASLVKSNDSDKRPREMITNTSSRGFGRPEPCRFVFNESTFPMNVRLPRGVLLSKTQDGNFRFLGSNDIVCFFDDVLMPFRIENNEIVIEVHRNPFESLYRPKEYDNLAVTIAVYRRGGQHVPTPGLDLARFSQPQVKIEQNGSTGMENSIDSKSSMEMKGSIDSRNSMDIKSDKDNKSMQVTKSEGGISTGNFAQGDILYKSTIRFYMRSPELGDGASDSESDEEEQAIPKGVVAKRRYHMAEHLQTAMTFKGQESFYTVIQGYLRGGFCSPEERASEKTKRNTLFSEVMKQNVAAARKYVSEMLVEVGTYYLKNCKNERDFRDGSLQLLDFAHSLGTVGLKPFQIILQNGPFLSQINNSKCFRFPRKFGNDLRTVLVTVTASGEISEAIEGIPSQSNQTPRSDSSNDLSADFDIDAFSKLSLSDEPTAVDKFQRAESQEATFYPASGLHSVNGSQSTHQVLTELSDPRINSNLPDIAPKELKSLPKQLEDFSVALNSYPQSFKYEQENLSIAFNQLREAVLSSGYMSPTDVMGQKATEITVNFWQAGLKWTCMLWPHDLRSKEGMEKQGLTESEFVSILSKWMNSKQYSEFDLMYSARMRVSHLKKLFRLFTNNLAPSSNFDPNKPMTPMGVVHFVQCVLLLLTPNGLLRKNHKILVLHAPLDLTCAIDCIYDALTNPKTEKWLILFRGGVSRLAGEAAWRTYKATEKPDEEVPFFLRLGEVRLENNIAYGLNLFECFDKKGEFEHMMLAVDVFNEHNTLRTHLVDPSAENRDFLGDWLLGYLTGASNSSQNSSHGKARYRPRRKRYRGGNDPNSSE